MNGYIKIIVVLILLKPIISGVVFGKNNEKYINFVIGLMIIVLLISPFTGVKKYKSKDYSHDFDKMNYEEIRRKSVKEEIEQRLNSDFGVNDVIVTLDEHYNITDVKSREQIKIKEYLGI